MDLTETVSKHDQIVDLLRQIQLKLAQNMIKQLTCSHLSIPNRELWTSVQALMKFYSAYEVDETLSHHCYRQIFKYNNSLYCTVEIYFQPTKQPEFQ